MLHGTKGKRWPKLLLGGAMLPTEGEAIKRRKHID